MRLPWFYWVGSAFSAGQGPLYGVLLAILIILNVRNGMGLLNITGETQTGVIGALLILSVLVPNIAREVRGAWNRRRRLQIVREGEEQEGG